jgi:spore coat polysaccharide biosynthesis protein SpsF
VTVGDILSISVRKVAIVQARMGSSRLPGKMMMDLCGQPLLFWVLSRVQKAALTDSTYLATSDEGKDDPLEKLARQLNVPVFRGSETDVLGRFLATAYIAKADYIVRVCGDNPLTAPEEIDRLVEFYEKTLQEGNTADKLYAFNFSSKMGNGYPNGFGAEILSTHLLEKLDKLDDRPSSREHVTSYIWSHPEQFIIRTFPAPKEIAYPSVRMDVDSQKDMNRLKVLCAQLDKSSSPQEIIQAYKKAFGL